MGYIILLAALVGGACIIFVYAFAKRNVLATIHNASRIINIASSLYLANQYKAKYGQEFGCALAAAVTNRLFGAQPTNDAGRAFLKNNGPLIQEQLAAIRYDRELCEAVSLATHYKANVAGLTRTVDAEMVQSWAELRQLGILLPDEAIQRPSSPDDFMRIAREFELWVMRM